MPPSRPSIKCGEASFALQLAASTWWLSRFRMGPLEWVWRCFTYWQWAPLRREPAAVLEREP